MGGAHEPPPMDARFSLDLRSWVGSCLASAPADRPYAADLLSRVPALYRVAGVSGSSGKTPEQRGSACVAAKDTASASSKHTVDASSSPPAFKPPARGTLAKASVGMPAAKAASPAASPVASVPRLPCTTPAVAVPLATQAAENIEFADAAASPPKAVAKTPRPDATTGASVQPSPQDHAGECSDAAVSSPAVVAEPEQKTSATLSLSDISSLAFSQTAPAVSPSRPSTVPSSAVGGGDPVVAAPALNSPRAGAPLDNEAAEVTIAAADQSEDLDTTLRPITPVATATAAASSETAGPAGNGYSAPPSAACSVSQGDDSGIGRSPLRQHRVARACSGKSSRRDLGLYVSRAQECWTRWRRERREAKGCLAGKVAQATKSEASSSSLASSCTLGLEVRGVAVPRTPKVERHAGRL